MVELTDLGLLEAIKRDEQAAFDAFFQRYFKVLTVFANKMIGDLDESQDLVQDIFIKLYEQRATLTIHTSVKAFLFQSTRNKCLDLIRSKNTKNEHHEQIIHLHKDDAVDYGDQMIQMELEERIYKAIAELPDQCQLIFKMNRLEGKRNQEIADALNISKRTVETQISNALKKLRKDIFQYVKMLIIISINFFL